MVGTDLSRSVRNHAAHCVLVPSNLHLRQEKLAPSARQYVLEAAEETQNGKDTDGNISRAKQAGI
jgi:hypothetical protein